tara:strand:+ start:272 stop:670 length:399 start_codon:yes stop_codon:yes gene_type:complete
MTKKEVKEKISNRIEYLKHSSDTIYDNWMENKDRSQIITYVDTITLSLSEIMFDRSYYFDDKKDEYPWTALYKDIEKNGLKTTPEICLGVRDQYEVINGHHRLNVLRKMHGDNYKVEVELHLNPEEVPHECY